MGLGNLCLDGMLTGKKKIESVPDAKNRTCNEKLKVDKAVKKTQNHVGNFDSYDIDKKSLEAVASSWTNETSVIWKQLGEQFIRRKNNEMTANLGQVAK